MRPGGIKTSYASLKSKVTSIAGFLFVLVLFVCLSSFSMYVEAAPVAAGTGLSRGLEDDYPMSAEDSGSDDSGSQGGTGGSGSQDGSGGSGSQGGTGGSGSQGGSGSSGKAAAERKPMIKIESVRLTDKGTTIIVSNGDIEFYYVLVKKADQAAPSAAEIQKNGIKSRDRVISMRAMEPDVEYVFYVVAEDAKGKVSDVLSKRGAISGSRGIEVMGRVYCTLQAKDVIDDQTSQIEEITINPGKGTKVKSIEYIIADKFLSSPGLIEAVATESEDVNTSAGTSTVDVSKWSTYSAKSKPGLVRNMLNYIYVKITDTDGTVSYISSCGIWEDETSPTAMSITPETDETSAVVTVTGNDDESGVAKYYLLVKDPMDLLAEDPENVKAMGLESNDGVFEIGGLSKNTRYDLCAVVEDNAGNLSAVTDGKMTTTGVQEASSVRQSEDTSNNPTGNSNVAKRTEGVTLEDPEVTEKVDENVPFIVASPDRDYDGFSKIAGWNNIGAVAERSSVPAEIYVDMNGGVVVPGDVLGRISGRDVTFHFIMDDMYIWTINGKGITSPPLSTDLRVVRDSGKIPAQLINDLAGVYPREVFSVAHVGELGFPATLDIRLGSGNAGKTAHLYRFNLEEYKLEPAGDVEVSDNGTASFTLPPYADFVAVIQQPSGSVTPGQETEPEEVRDTAGDFANTKKESKNLWIIFVSVIGVLLIIFIIFTPGEKNKDSRDSDE